MSDYEKLGLFYLGRAFDLESKTRKTDLILYDSRDLVTHAVCVGMTGSGKTGLCIALLEEAAIDNLPAIVIDPKGDLSNLLLTFPDLKPADFRPWIDEDEARRKSLEPDAFAAAEAERWAKGLGEWQQDGARIRRLRDAVDMVVYTPGSQAGVPVSVLKSFAAPSAEVVDDSDLMRERVSTTATSLLGLAGIDADPVQVARAHSHLDPARYRVASGTRSRRGRAHPADPVAAGHQGRRPRAGSVLPVQGSLRAGDGAQQPARGAWLQRLDGGRAARPSTHPAHVCRQAARRDLLDRAPERRRAHVLRLAAAQSDAGMDARAVGHDQPAGAPLHGRDLRLSAARRESAVEARRCSRC